MIKSALAAVSDNLNRRTTSHAKTLDLNEQTTALDRARALREEFERAKASSQKSLEQEKPREPDPNKRTTSHAKTVDLGEQKNSLDRARALKEQFGRTNVGHEHAREQQNIPQQQRTAEASHAPRPEAHLRPAGEIRRAVDREIDKEKLAREDQRARQASEAYKARLNQARLNRNKEMDREI
jgi:hypothetical protein